MDIPKLVYLEEYIQPFQPKKEVARGTKWTVAADNSGSTSWVLNGMISNPFTGNPMCVLDHTKYLLRKLDYRIPRTDSIIAWNSTVSKTTLDSMHSTGGTVPSCLVPSLESDRRTLIMTTDGDIHESEVKKFTQDITKSNITHAFCFFISSRNENPAKLNLPVFAPLLNSLQGTVCIYHYDGTLKMLLTNNPQLHYKYHLPEDVTNEMTWDDFPSVDMETVLDNEVMETPKPPSGCCYVLMREIFNFDALYKKLLYEDSPSILRSQELQDILFLSNLSSIDDHDIDTFKKIVKMWYDSQLEFAKELCEPYHQKFQGKEQRLKELQQRSDLDNEEKEEMCKLMKLSYEFHVESRLRYKRFLSSAENFFQQVMKELGKKQVVQAEDYSLASLATSNRAKRSNVLKRNKEEEIPEQWELGTLLSLSDNGECDICCSENTPQALLLLCPTREQIEFNTSDFAMNNALAIAPNNENLMPHSQVCIYCADYLQRNNMTCPYTRQTIQTYLPVLTSRSDPAMMQLLAERINHALFGGRDVGIAYTALISLLTWTRHRNSRAVESLLSFMTLYTKSNLSRGVISKPILQDMKDQLVSFSEKNPTSNEWSTIIENMSLHTPTTYYIIFSLLNLMNQGIEEKKMKIVFKRMVFKTLIHRYNHFLKGTDAQHIRNLIIRAIYDCNVNIPILDSEKIISEDWSDGTLLCQLVGELSAKTIQKFLRQCSFDELFYPEEITYILYNLWSIVSTQYKNDVLVNYFIHNIEYVGFMLTHDRSGYFSSVVKDKMKENFSTFYRLAHDDPHFGFAAYSQCSLYAPSTIVCICGEKFVTEEEISVANLDHLAEEAYANKKKHFEQVYGDYVPSSRSGHYNLHTTVRRAMDELGVNENTLVDKKMIMTILYILYKERKGCIYSVNLLEGIIKVCCNYLQRYRAGIRMNDDESCYRDRFIQEIKLSPFPKPEAAEYIPEMMVCPVQDLLNISLEEYEIFCKEK